MEIYIYSTPYGLVGDFRPYLGGEDRSFDPPRPLVEGDPRWEKVNTINCPRTGELIGGQLRFVRMGEIQWYELLRFPTPIEG